MTEHKDQDSETEFRPKRAVWPIYLLGTLLVLLILNNDFSGRYRFLSSSSSSQLNAEWAKRSSLFRMVERPLHFEKKEVHAEIITPIEESSTSVASPAVENVPDFERAKREGPGAYTTTYRPEPALNRTEMMEAPQFSVDYDDILEYDYARKVRLQYAQAPLYENDKDFSRKNQWLAGGSAGPQSANAFVKPPNEKTLNSFLQENVSHSNTSLVSATLDNALAVNVNIGKAVTNKVEVYSGVGYNRFNGTQTSHYQGIEEIVEITYEPVEGGYRKVVNKRETALTDTVRANYTAHLIELPLYLRYNMGSHRLSYFFSGGMSASLASGYSASYTSTAAEGGNSYSSGLGLQAYSFNLGVGLQYGLNKNLMLRLEPTYRYTIPTAESAIFYENLNSIGVLTGIFFFFD